MLYQTQRNLVKFVLVLALIHVSTAQERRPSLGELVPTIKTDYYELQPAADNKYRLRITHPDGSQRIEMVELRAAGTPEEELFVQGTIDNQYPDTGGRLVVFYEAGKNGYITKVRYQGRPTADTTFGSFAVSANALKSSVG